MLMHIGRVTNFRYQHRYTVESPKIENTGAELMEDRIISFIFNLLNKKMPFGV